MSRVEVEARGIKNRLKSVKSHKALAEYVWNGFDAGADTVSIDFECTEIGDIFALCIADNGSGIPFPKLVNKFKPVLSSEKRDSDRDQSLVHGKHGLGRLTFYHFAQTARWETSYKEDRKIYSYSITVDESKIDHYEPTQPELSEGKATGTKVSFLNIFDLSDFYFESKIKEYFRKEFSWFLELNREKAFSIVINGHPLSYESLVKDFDEIIVNTENNEFLIRYVRWASKLNSHFSRFYCIDGSDSNVYSRPTTFNNKGDSFYHSVYIRGSFFNDFKVGEKVRQSDLLSENSDQSEEFKELITEINGFLRRKRKPFVVDYAKTLVEQYESDGVFPEYNSKNRWEVVRAEDLREAVSQLYQVEPRIFNSLNRAQKKTLVGFLALIIDGGEVEDLFRVLDGVIDLTSSERELFAKQLMTTKMSSIVRTIELISDRYKSVSDFKRMVFDPSMYAGEVPHLQKMMEKNYWLIGEEYQLLTAAEPDFEEALRRYLHLLRGYDERTVIDHEDKNREMDLFLVRQDKRNGVIENVVVELKHPVNVRLGKKELDQVYDYFNVIKSESRFNASNMTWKFFLVGNKLDSKGYIEDQINALKMHGEPGLAHISGDYRVYVYTWSEIFNEFELRHSFLDKKLKLERDRLTSFYDTADDMIERKRSSDAAPELAVPKSNKA